MRKIYLLLVFSLVLINCVTSQKVDIKEEVIMEANQEEKTINYDNVEAILIDPTIIPKDESTTSP